MSIEPAADTRGKQTEIMKILNVAEKNAAAKQIARHLSRGTYTWREGLYMFNKIYEFECEVMGQKCQMVMTSVSGHLLNVDFKGRDRSWDFVNPSRLLSRDARVETDCINTSNEDIKKTLQREVNGCSGLIIWTDCDREGENIGFQIKKVCTEVNSDLAIYRARFSEITSVSTWRALNSLEQPNSAISSAVDVRRELDLRTGAAFTRFLTLRLRERFPVKVPYEQQVSYGSCQLPTLGFVVERYKAIENFVPEQLWTIKVNHTMNNLSVDFSWDRNCLPNHDECQQIYNGCLESPLAEVCYFKTEPISKCRPLPLNTVELQKLASRKLNIKAKETMGFVEKLYLEGLISYPRTETNKFPKELNLTELVKLQTQNPNWGSFAEKILRTGGPTPREGDKSDSAHPPIYPTQYRQNIRDEKEKLLYELIVRSFLACCFQDAQGDETKVSIKIADEKFSASGLKITAMNYLEVYGQYDEWLEKEIHDYQTLQSFIPSSIEIIEASTSPPKLLTEADLIDLMETHGIGTDATHAEHIESIKFRKYAIDAENYFIPTPLGLGLVEGYDAMELDISKPDLRAKLEADLKAIIEGRKTPPQVLEEQLTQYRIMYTNMESQVEKLYAALERRFNEQLIEDSMPTDVPMLDAVPENIPSDGNTSDI